MMPPPPIGSRPEPKQEKAAKKKSALLPILLVLLLLIALVGGGLYVYHSGLLDDLLQKESPRTEYADDEEDEEEEEAEDAEDEDEAAEQEADEDASKDDSADQSPAPEKDTPAERPADEATGSAEAVPSPNDDPYSQQEILVKCNGSSATLTLMEWDGDGWFVQFSTTAEIGSNGTTSRKQEGDRCTPAGTFDILFCFSADPLVAGIPRIQTRQNDVWVCDSDSDYYNTLQSSTAPYKDWDASENMYTKFTDDRSVACIYFGYNGDGQTAGSATPNGGSALFLDGVGSNGNMSSGYGDIKISGSDMLLLLQCLDSTKNPVITIA